jgi:hypothetical protein
VRRLLETLSNDLLLKLTALGLAFLLWVSLDESDDQVSIDSVPVEVVSQDAGWITVGEPDPATVRVVFSGPVRELFRVAAERPVITVPVTTVSDTSEVFVLRPAWVSLGADLRNTRVDEFRPSAVRISFDRLTTRTIPVAVPVIGRPEMGFELAGPIELQPASVRASGASRIIEHVDTIRLPAIDLARRTATDTIVVPLDSMGPGVIVTPREIRAIVPIRAVNDTVDVQPSALPQSVRSDSGP